jgi:hypothetical protein
MNHLYAIKFTVSDKADFFEELKHKALAYVLAECPYQAMYFVRNKLLGGKWNSNENEFVEKIKPQHRLELHQKGSEPLMPKDVYLDIHYNPQLQFVD